MGDVEVEAALTAPPLTAAELEAKKARRVARRIQKVAGSGETAVQGGIVKGQGEGQQRLAHAFDQTGSSRCVDQEGRHVPWEE